jgi:hypothetical protein
MKKYPHKGARTGGVDRIEWARSAILAELVGRSPRGMTSGQMGHYLGLYIPASRLHELLAAMVGLGELVERSVPGRGRNTIPMVEYYASDDQVRRSRR